MMSIFRSRDLLCVAIFLLPICFSSLSIADDDKSTEEQSEKQSGEQSSAVSSADDVEQESAVELVDRLRQLNRKSPEGNTREEKFNNYRDIQEETLKIADLLYKKTMAAEDSEQLNFAAIALQAKYQASMMLARLAGVTGGQPSPEPFLGLAAEGEQLYNATQTEEGFQVAGTSVQVVVQALKVAEQLDGSDAAQKLKTFLEQVSGDSRPQVAAFGKQQLLQSQLQLSPNSDAAAVDRVVAILKKEFSDRAVQGEDLQVIMEAVMQIEQLGQTAAALNLCNFFADKFAASDQEQIRQFASMLAGTARRLELPGHALELSGTFLDGTDLDWASYRGKVVLVDFWATWCGPCRAEFPKVIANYEKYHDQGFDVIGINLDEEKSTVEAFLAKEKLPWKTLFSDQAGESGFNNPMARRYGISGIPTVILVDREGKVVSLNARGPELERLLADQFAAEDKEKPEGS